MATFDKNRKIMNYLLALRLGKCILKTSYVHALFYPTCLHKNLYESHRICAIIGVSKVLPKVISAGYSSNDSLEIANRQYDKID